MTNVELGLSRGVEAERNAPGLILFDKDRTLILPAGENSEIDTLPYAEGEILRFPSDNYHPEVVLRKGAVGFLRRLRLAGLRCGIVTKDTDVATLGLVEIIGGDVFHPDAIMTCDTPVPQKPHPDPFLTAAFNLGIPPENCVMIGDHLSDDIAGAKQAGMKTVLVEYWGYGEEDFEEHGRPDLTVANFDELTLDILKAL